ncbi:hypothetical protein [uncultured Duncaniella sp.]|uniref:hypothetical protein n=1 Tax=uncultured Duncaniella sp. TaxID=2768039 RepID=UPI0026394DD7|nr:hypothetical protein [uncultured Duncaniella sp.]
MKFFKYIIPVLTLWLLGACSDDLQPDKGQQPVVDQGDTIRLNVSLNVADMTEASSRAFGDVPDYSDLKLYVAEFVLGDSPLEGSVLSNICDVENENLNSDGDIHFSLTLNKTFEPRVLHLMAVPKSVELNIPYGLEGAVIPAIIFDNSTPVYWQRIEFPDGYGSFNGEAWTTAPDLVGKLTHVPMIRNFAKVSLNVTDPNFTLTGFAVLNTPVKGTAAPWNSTSMSFPAFLNGNSVLSYSEISNGYNGISPSVEVENSDPEAAVYDTASKYLYERPASSINNTVVIMAGRKAGGQEKFYKIDLGYADDDKVFHYYNILRNFEYAITVTKVGAEGYATKQEAMDGVVFNNFSFDINTNQMLNISDGTDMLWVNQTTFVVTDEANTTVSFRYRYKKNISSGGGTLANGEMRFRDLVAGDAIISVEYGTTDDSDGWREVRITTPTPTLQRKSQEFVIFNPNSGLGRTINLIVRRPWYYTDLQMWGGNYNVPEDFDKTDKNGWQNFASTTTGQPLTVFLRIEDNIPESVFPLTFTFESDRQNIENNKIGNLIVTSGPSLFDNSKTTIQYVKTVTWTDYNTVLSKENPTALLVTRDGETYRRVRARFLSIYPISTTETTTIRVYNPYMKLENDNDSYADITFRGKAGTPPNNQ